MKQIEPTVKTKDYSTISIDKLVKHLNLDADLADAEQLESILKASIDWVENRTNSFITPTTIEYTDYEFSGNTIELEHKGVNTITSVTVDGALVTDFRSIRKYTSTFLVLSQSVNPSKIIINYTAGNTPTYNFIQAVLITAADMFDVDRSNYSAGLVNNRTVNRLLNLE